MGQPAKKLEHKDAAHRRRAKAYKNRQQEAEAIQASIIPAAPEYFDGTMRADWEATAQQLADNSLLLPVRLSFLEQYCVLRAKVRADGIETAAGLQSVLTRVTCELWKPAQTLQPHEEQNAFKNL